MRSTGAAGGKFTVQRVRHARACEIDKARCRQVAHHQTDIGRPSCTYTV